MRLLAPLLWLLRLFAPPFCVGHQACPPPHAPEYPDGGTVQPG